MSFCVVPNYTSLVEALCKTFGKHNSIVHTDRISGGDINKSYALTLATGERIFMKANEKENHAFFEKEAKSLFAISSTNTIATEKVFCTGTDDGEKVGYSFLLAEFIYSKENHSIDWKTFAEELASLHKADCKKFSLDKKFGFFEDNFIGTTVQKNTVNDSWIDFFRECRLSPQLKMAEKYFDLSFIKKANMLLDNIDKFIIESEKASLVHGDLWRGNIVCGDKGRAYLVDAASFCGNREVDIAMTELFGGFPKDFYDVYNDVYKLENGYEKRRDIYNLYHLLNHLNLFGETYLKAVYDIITEYTGVL